MTRQRGVRSGVVALMLIATLAACWAEGTALAADATNKMAGLQTSLRLVPDSAAFYAAALRGREQVELVLNSRAFAKLRQLPIVQMGLGLYQMQAATPDSIPGKIQQALEDPQVKELLALLADMFGQEVFLYGDMSSIDVWELIQQMQRGGQVGQIVGALGGKNPGRSQAQMTLQVLAENVARVRVPNFVVGFKLNDRQRAVAQLAKLELILGILLQQNPHTKQALQRTKVAGHEYLVITLNGQMIPWDQVPLDGLKEQLDQAADFDKLIAQVKKQKLVITIGLRENYLLFGIGASTDAVAALGQGKRLVDRAEWKRLNPHAAQRITGIGYIGATARQRLVAAQLNLDGLVQQVEQVLPATKLKAELQQRITKDVKGFAACIKGYLPKVGTAVAVSYLTASGAENYSYQWDAYGNLDGSRPLSLLDHVGGNPLLAFVLRGKKSVADYDKTVQWLGVAWRYVEEFGLPRMDDEDRQLAKKVITRIRPVLKRIDTANRELLLPALADGQGALVLDAKLKSKQFLRDLPATEKPMPMLEPAFVYGVRDPALLRKGAAEYLACLKEILKIIDDVSPNPEPVLTLPPAKLIKTAVGEVASYPLPDAWGVDPQVAPTFAMSDKVAVITSSPAMAQRLLKATPLKAGGVLADLQRPRAMAFVFNWAALVDAAKPWVEFGLQQAGASLGEQREAIAAQVGTVLDVLKVLRTVTSEYSIDGPVVVARSHVEYRDLP
jgi:hypothetical protein